MTRLPLHTLGATSCASYFSFIPAGLRTDYGSTHMEGACSSFSKSSHRLQSNTTDSRAHIEATQVIATRMRKLKDGPFLAEHTEL